MPIDFSNITNQIRQAGSKNVRAVPMTNQPALSGKYQIEVAAEVHGSRCWTIIATDIDKGIAESLIAQATNRVICG